MRTLVASLVFACALMLAPLAEAADVTLQTTDGVAVHAVDYGKGTNAVVLIHDKARSGADWSWYAEKLAANGFHVIAIDLRGHGQSALPTPLVDADYPKMTADVTAAIAWLKSKGATKLSIIGANMGANLAVLAAAEDPTVTNLILLSPGLNLSGVTPSAAMEKYGKRPVLIVASTEDGYAMRTATVLEEKATGEKHVEVLENAGSGVKMLNKSPSLETTMIAWLNGTYFLKPGEKAPGSGPAVKADTTTMTTTGTKFGEKKPDAPPEPPKGPVDLDQ